jgi:hypothetical protein
MPGEFKERLHLKPRNNFVETEYMYSTSSRTSIFIYVIQTACDRE